MERRAFDPDELAALEGERDFLLRSLEDLEREHEAGDLDDGDFDALKDDYTARAAAVITRIDQRMTVLTAAPRPHRWYRIGVVIAVLTVVSIGAGWFVAASSGQREPGDTITGDIRTSSIDELARARDQAAAATGALQAGDNDEAVDAFRRAMDSYREVLAQQPENVEALTYRGWLLHIFALASPADVAEGLDADALASLSRAIEVRPDYADARIFRAILHEDAGRIVEAGVDLDAVDPDDVPPEMSAIVNGLRSRVSSAQPGG